jgi:sulfur carrier protein ThiS
LEKKKRFVIVGIIIAFVIGIWFIIEPREPMDKTTSNSDIMLMHIHPRLYLNIDGKPYFVPQNVGIDPALWKDHTLDQYGMKGMAPLHTHTADGMIHVESTVVKNYTLGEFIDILGLDLRGKSVNVTVNGEPVSDYRSHIFQDEESIIMNITSNR